MRRHRAYVKVGLYECGQKPELADSASLTRRIVNFGCGPYPGEGCINIDGSITVLLAHLPIPARIFGARAGFVRAVRTFGIRHANAKRMDFPQSSLDGFYASHALEHISRDECERLLGRVRRWLKPSGVLRVVLPDLRRLAEEYLSGKIDADRFVGKTYLVAQSHSLTALFGHRDHRWMYDPTSFGTLLAQTGYRDIEHVSFGTSRLEGLGRLDIETRAAESFYIEASN